MRKNSMSKVETPSCGEETRLEGRGEEKFESGHSLRRKVFVAFFLLTLVCGGIFGGVLYAVYDTVSSRLVQWHMEPILRMLIASDQAAERHGRGEAESDADFGGKVAAAMGVRLYKDANVPLPYRPYTQEQYQLTRIASDHYALSFATDDGDLYVIEGKIEDFAQVGAILRRVFGVFFLFCVVLSLASGAVLSRQLTSPLLALARRVREGEPVSASPLCHRKDELGFLARAFARREAELSDYLAREQAFTGDVSHELRTPLTVLRSGVEILEDFTRDAEGMSPARKGAILSTLERMQRTGRDMAETLGTMLLLARRPAHLELRDLDMDELMAAQMDFWRPVAERKGLELVFVRTAGEDAVSAVGNAELAAMIVKNLLENAVRYTESGYVRVELEESGLCVRNSAPPLDEEARRRIFERGERGTSDASSGSGLGLSLALRACKHMGWSIACETDAGGNLFRVRFGEASSSSEGVRRAQD